MTNTQSGAAVAADAEIAERIISALVQSDMSAHALSARVGIAYKTLDRSLKGIRPLTVPELGRIADALGAAPSELIAAA